MPRIAVLFEFPTLNGGEHSMLAVMGMLNKQADMEFVAIAPATGPLAEKLRQIGISVEHFTVRCKKGIRQPPESLHIELQRILQNVRPDLLHANSLSMSRLVGQLSLPPSLACRRTGHLRDIIGLKKKVISDLNANDGLVAVSAATRNYHVSQGLQADRCQVIYNGVDTAQFAPRDREEARREVFPELPLQAKIVLNVGQICLRKGQRAAAAAVCELLTHRRDVYLVVVGERHSQKQESRTYEAALTEQFAAIGRSQHLRQIGYRSDIPRLMNASDVLLHTAHQEPFGRTLLEAAASGLPIVATSVGGTPEMLRHKRDALLVGSNDHRNLQHSLQQLLSDSILATQLAVSARERMVEKFSLASAAENLSQFWRWQHASGQQNAAHGASADG